MNLNFEKHTSCTGHKYFCKYRGLPRRSRVLRGRARRRWTARFHLLEEFAQPATISSRAVGARPEPDGAPDGGTKQRIAEHQNKQIRGGEQRLFQTRRPPSLLLRSPNPARMHSFRCRFKEAGLHGPVAMAGKNQPSQHARHSAARSNFVEALEHALDVRLFGARPSFEELSLKSAIPRRTIASTRPSRLPK